MRRVFAKLMLTSLLLTACGDNLFEAISKSKPAEDASKELEQGKPQAAVQILTEALGSEFRILYLQLNSSIAAGESESISTDLAYTVANIIATGSVKDAAALVSILSSAHAKIYGIDPLDIALELAKNSSDSAETSSPTTAAGADNEIALLFPVLPEASDDNINGLTGARIILDAIGTEHFTPADYFKKALYLTANTSLITKQLDKDLDGNISVLEASDMSNANADLVLDLLLDAATSVTDSSQIGENSTSEASAEKIAQIREKILSSEGTSDAEKLKNYLSSQSTSSISQP